jgi:hypothetical protein
MLLSLFVSFLLLFCCCYLICCLIEMDNLQPNPEALPLQVSSSSLHEDGDDAASSSSFASSSSSLSSSALTALLPQSESTPTFSSVQRTQFRRHQPRIDDDQDDYVDGDAEISSAAEEEINLCTVSPSLHHPSSLHPLEDYNYDVTSLSQMPKPKLQQQARLLPSSASSSTSVIGNDDDFVINDLPPQIQHRQPHLTKAGTDIAPFTPPPRTPPRKVV